MKKQITFLLVLFLSLNSIAQDNIGIGTTSPNSNSILDISTDSKGLLIPRLTTTQRTTLGSVLGIADDGMLIYDKNTHLFYYWNETQWIPFPQIGGTSTDNQNLTNAILTGNSLQIDIQNGNSVTVDLSSLAGNDGVQGPIGLTGAAGTNGNDGAQGPIGLTGVAGTNGNNGAQGPIGLTGAAGANGAGLDEQNLTNATLTGNSLQIDIQNGNSVTVDLSSLAGNDGAQGPIGLTGIAGTNGNDGTQGPIGLTGAAGTNGNDGTQGPTGLTGAAGTNGNDGAQGPIGLTGAAGTNGNDGAQGPIGLTGAAGANGNDGAQGPIGLTGAAGTNGNDGAQGPTGLTGAAGTNGNVGAQGPQGDPATDDQTLTYTPNTDILAISGGNNVTINDKWDILGNSNTNPTTNFIGTTNSFGFAMRTNNIERYRVLTNGTHIFNATTPVYTSDLFGINGRSTATTTGFDFVLNVYGEGTVNDAASIYSHQNGIGAAIWAEGFATASGMAVIFSESETTIDPAVEGRANFANTASVGVLGNANITGDFDPKGIYGRANTTNANWGYGVYGEGNYYGVYTPDDMGAGGTKTFMIDHPLDPENKTLKHFSMESNEIINMYRGVEAFDANGEVIIQLPDYFNAININFSYQFSAIGMPLPNIYVKKEIDTKGNFVIAGGQAGAKVSWNVYANRNDKYVQTHPNKTIAVEDKKASQKGKYFQPKVWGKPAQSGINYINIQNQEKISSK